MTALETQLTEIVEKEQGQKIIPFLQKLTQEERKSLIPCLSRLEEYYNKFVSWKKGHMVRVPRRASITLLILPPL